MEAELYNKNTRVMSVTIENTIVTKLGEIYEHDALPFYLRGELTLEKFNKWLLKRRIPLNREGLKEAKQMFGSKAFQNYEHMCSLTDQYWFKTKKKDSWQNLNFFTNQYSSAVGQSLFTPWTVNKDDLKKESPDMTTNGVLRKVWIQDPATLTSYLVKAGSKKFQQEPISEVLATLTLQKIRVIPFVKYDLCVNGMRVCSRCKNFVNANTEFVTAQAIYNLSPRKESMTKYEHLLYMCERFGLQNPADFIDRMLFADMIVGNTDRHFGNFGALYNVDKKKVEGFVPLFDFGSAFHEFSPEVQTKPKIFEEESERILQTFGCLPSLENLKDNADLFRFIDTYPDFSIQQKDAIKHGIEERTKFFTSL